ncbi:hypothetical protein Tco_0143971 [Tanacetum coccineum]
MLVIKIFSKGKKVFRERKKCEKIRTKRSDFSKEWISIYRQENPMVTGDGPGVAEAVEKRFGGNAATKKTQRNLLKQKYENFTTPSLEMLDQTFDRLQKLVSQLELLDEKLSQEDVNKKILRSLPPE